MNDLLEAKLLISMIKTKILDLTGSLISDNFTDKDYCISQLLTLVEFIEENDIRINELKGLGNHLLREFRG